MRTTLLTSVSLSAIGLTALVGCSQGSSPAISSPVVSPAVTTTTTTTSAVASAAPVTPSSSEEPTPSVVASPAAPESSYSATAIRSIAIETTTGLGGSSSRVGPELYQISGKNGYTYVEIHWAARGENGNVQSRDCTVVVDVTGPGGLDERRRTDKCTSKTDGIKVRAVGVYNVSVSITPPEGGAPVIGTHTFEVILKGT